MLGIGGDRRAGRQAREQLGIVGDKRSPAEKLEVKEDRQGRRLEEEWDGMANGPESKSADVYFIYTTLDLW